MKHRSVVLRAAGMFVVALATVAGACTMKSQDAPPLSGPSEFGTSVTVNVSPDVLTQDGASQSLVTITARDSNGNPLRNVSLRAEISVAGVRADFGTLSARNLVTDNAGRATLVYTAPAATQGGAVDTGTVVDILVTPVGSDFNNSTSRIASIRLVPPGIVLPPNGTPVPNFTFSPTTAQENVRISFDASSSTDDGRIVGYSWTFGDGDSGTGVTISRAYEAAGSYNVTLTVTDDRGLSASKTQTVTIGAGTNPSAVFTVSPTPVVINAVTRFDATLSTPASGRQIVSYSWNFGDGGSGTGVAVTHTFTSAGTFAVTLTVTDDVGKVGVSNQSVAVGATAGGDPVASFITLPSAPTVNETVTFNGAPSTTSTGRTITTYGWNFGDGATGSGVTTTHAYNAAGIYVVTLTVTDSAGRTGLTIREITIGAGGPTARLNVSPLSATINSTVQANGSASTAQPGRTIVDYSFNFADGTPVVSGPSPTVSHTYTAAGTYSITLTVRDSSGATASTSQSVAITASQPPVASFVYSPPSPRPVGTTFTFDASQSQAPQNASLNRYQWQFDGAPTAGVCTAPAAVAGPVFTTTSTTITHQFNAAGTFCVALTVFDNQGGTNTTFRLLSIQ